MIQEHTGFRGWGTYRIPVSVVKPCTIWPVERAGVVYVFGAYPEISIVHYNKVKCYALITHASNYTAKRTKG